MPYICPLSHEKNALVGLNLFTIQWPLRYAYGPILNMFDLNIGRDSEIMTTRFENKKSPPPLRRVMRGNNPKGETCSQYPFKQG